MELSVKGRVGPHPPTPIDGIKAKSGLYVMKRILYDMGHLTVAKCPLIDVFAGEARARGPYPIQGAKPTM